MQSCRSRGDFLTDSCRSLTEPGVGKTAVAEAIAQVLASAISDQQETKKFKFPISNPFANKDGDNNEDETPTDEIEYTLPACPTSLAGARLISIELASLVAGTANRGDFEKRIQNLIKEASGANVILFIDEIHNLIGTGGGGDGYVLFLFHGSVNSTGVSQSTTLCSAQRNECRQPVETCSC